jgi:hypothetical protein
LHGRISVDRLNGCDRCAWAVAGPGCGSAVLSQVMASGRCHVKIGRTDRRTRTRCGKPCLTQRVVPVAGVSTPRTRQRHGAPLLGADSAFRQPDGKQVEDQKQRHHSRTRPRAGPSPSPSAPRTTLNGLPDIHPIRRTPTTNRSLNVETGTMPAHLPNSAESIIRLSFPPGAWMPPRSGGNLRRS